jgi:hypothetical protein
MTLMKRLKSGVVGALALHGMCSSGHSLTETGPSPKMINGSSKRVAKARCDVAVRLLERRTGIAIRDPRQQDVADGDTANSQAAHDEAASAAERRMETWTYDDLCIWLQRKGSEVGLLFVGSGYGDGVLRTQPQRKLLATGGDSRDRFETALEHRNAP